MSSEKCGRWERVITLLLALILFLGLTPAVRTAAEEAYPFLEWATVKSDDFSGGTAGTPVHGRNGWTVAGGGAVSEMKSTLAADPADGGNTALQLERTSSGGFAPASFTIADTAEKELNGKVYVSADFYVEQWSSFEIQVQTSNETSLVRAYLMANAWYNNRPWEKVAPLSGTFGTGRWFTLGILMDTEAGTYELYLNDQMLTGGRLEKQGANVLEKTGRGVGKIRFDIDIGQSGGKFCVDNLIVKSETGGGEIPDEPDTDVAGREIIARQDFSVPGPDSLGQSIFGWNDWSLRNKPVSPAMYWTIEADPDNKEGVPFTESNQVMRARRVKVGSANEWAIFFAKAGGEPVEARGEVHLKFRIKQESAENNFILRVRNNQAGDGWGNTLVSFIIRPSGQVIETASGWQPIGKFSPKTWNTLELVINTETKVYDLYVNGAKGNETSLPLAGNGDGYDPHVSVLDLDIEKASKGENVWYIDDLEIWTDHTEELKEKAELLRSALLSGEINGDIALPQPEMGAEYSIKWESSNPAAVAADGKVTKRGWRQQASLTATITRNADIPYVQNASAKCRFDFTVLPNESVTDEALLEELKEEYYTASMLTDESLTAITQNIRPIAAAGPEGVAAVLSSSDPSVDCETGAVIRPEAGEAPREVILTLTLIKNNSAAIKEFPMIILPKMTDSERLDEAEAWLKSAALTPEKPSQLKYGLILPEETENGVAVSWSSNKPDAIGADGTVHRGAEDTPVVLTATLTADTETRDVEFSFTVRMSPAVMAEIDAGRIELEPEDLGRVTDTFTVPISGALYNSDIVWSTDRTDVIQIIDGVATVVQPEFQDGDAAVVITAVVRNETAALAKTFTVTVPALPSDGELITEAEEWLTWERISLDAADEVRKNLALPTSYGHGVAIMWESSDPSVVTETGLVINPPIGADAANIRLKAAISKNTSKTVKEFTLRVPAFRSVEEILEKATDSLSFLSLGGQSVNAVTENLTLPKVGAGGTQITWESSDTALLSIGEGGEGGLTGLVNRPAAGGNDGYVTLTATISSGGEAVTKRFYLTVKPQDEWTEIYRHDYNSFGVGDLPTYSGGDPVWPTEAYASYRVAADPVNPSNKAALFYRGAYAANVENESWYFFRHSGNALYDGELVFSGRMFIDEEMTDTLWLDIVAKNGSQVCVGFYPDSTLRCQVIEGGVVYYTTREPVIKRGQWMDFRFELDSSLKTYQIYIDGECVTEEEKLHLNNQPVSLPWGVPYNYYQDPSRSTQIQGWRIYYLGNNSGVPSYVYLDDVCFEQKTTYNAKLLEAKTNLERDLLARINPNAVTQSFVMPDTTDSSVKLAWYTSDVSVLRTDGAVFPGETDRKVTLTAELSLGGDTIYRPFALTVKSIYASEGWSDEEIVAADIKNIAEQLEKNYNLSALTESMKLPKRGNYGSVLSWSSSDEGVITAEGTVTRENSSRTAVLTLTAQKGNASESAEITVTVAAGRGGPSPSATVSGSNSKGNSGIVLPPVEPEEKTDFSDLPESHWAYEAVSYLVEKRVVTGVDSEHFEPERPVTRAEFAKLLVCTFDLIPSSADAPRFIDVAEKDWYYQYVRTLSALGLIQGMGDGSFGAGREISRQDMAVIMYRLLEAEDFHFSGEAAVPADGTELSDYAVEAVGRLLAEGVVSGDTEGNFRGNEPASRAQAAAMLYNCLRRTSGMK